MTDISTSTASAGTRGLTRHRFIRWTGFLSILAGVVMLVAGGVVWGVVSSQLADQHITVASDSEWFPGANVTDPFTALAEANIINEHALHSSEGKTYAQLDKEDPLRATVMNASFLRASLFTSVVSFGVSFFAMGVGLMFGLFGGSLVALTQRARPGTV
ncbi:aromatic ring-opening dioxygenase LigA [Leifsonia poae]|uniref:Aromatic ring-opening dioxygenase LigA n=1 Tax=Leifsonia poae TaxID=110933 RepID=A0A9W6HB39_9MICO|nr:aromatic ring-opening dioxygenase LigA [Leifsonia poae]GLJ76871.1 hypothetical protein GCM10017584_24450 [Leifsonia poae]